MTKASPSPVQPGPSIDRRPLIGHPIGTPAKVLGSAVHPPLLPSRDVSSRVEGERDRIVGRRMRHRMPPLPVPASPEPSVHGVHPCLPTDPVKRTVGRSGDFPLFVSCFERRESQELKPISVITTRNAERERAHSPAPVDRSSACPAMGWGTGIRTPTTCSRGRRPTVRRYPTDTNMVARWWKHRPRRDDPSERISGDARCARRPTGTSTRIVRPTIQGCVRSIEGDTTVASLRWPSRSRGGV